MKKILCSIILLLCCSQFIILADDCSDALNEAKTLYNNGDYAKAKSLFEYVKSECGSSYGDATNWITKCNDALTPKLSLSRTSISVGASSGSTSITVTSNRTWELRNTSSSIFSVSKSGNTITIQYYFNSSTNSRNDYFDVVTTDGSKSVRVNFYQGGKSASPSLSVSKTSISASASGTTEYITVTCNTTWEVQYPTGTMYNVTRNGNTLTININAHSSTESRSDYFNVRTTDGSKVQKIQLIQSGASTLSVSKTSISCSASGTTEYITVTSTKPWEIQYASGTMYSVTRSGNTLTVKINANSSTESRSDYFNVRTTDGSKVQKIELTQYGRTSSSSNSYAVIENAWIEHNVYQNNIKGMKVHAKFSAYNIYNHKVGLVLHFVNSDGFGLKDYNNSYSDANGHVAHSDNAIASYTNTTWSDFVVFFPYSELHMTSGCKNVTLKVQLGIYDWTSSKWLTDSNAQTISFTFSN